MTSENGKGRKRGEEGEEGGRGGNSHSKHISARVKYVGAH